MKIECNHNKTDTEFHQVVTIELDVTANFTLELYEDYILKLNIEDLTLYPAYIFDTEYKINMVFLRTKMTIVDGVVMGFIDAIFENGTSIQDFVEKTPLCFINMTKAQATSFDGYLVLAIQPMFDHEGCKGDWSLAGKEFFDQFNIEILE